MAAISYSTMQFIRYTTVSSRPCILSPMASHPSLVFVAWNSRHRQISKFSEISGPCHRNSKLVPKSSDENNDIVPSEGDPEDGVSLGTMKLPSDIDIARFQVLLFQWANSLCQGANLPFPVPLKVDKIPSGVRLGFITIGDGKTEVLVYIDCLVFPATATTSPIFRAIRNGRLKDQSPPGEPRIMRSLLSALTKSVEISRMEELKTADRMCGYEVENGFDAIVIGSGYGGSVAACWMSMAGIKVCLLEKGRKWESQDFVTDSMKITSAVRMENRNVGISFGPKDALFQVYEQNDSLATVACGLGGGSLVNAGVMLPTPVLVRRDPSWPKEWERDWSFCEAAAAAMLKVQSIPIKFPSAKVFEEIVGEEIEGSFESSVNLSMNFDLEESLSNSRKIQQRGNCLACRNCLAGCPYNAKNSTDKYYLLTAIQAGCVVGTTCQVQYVVKNSPNQEGRASRKRRWPVYFNEIDFIACDFVILSVFGTTEILFRSQLRGLKVSEALGCGFSCNGNAVAYLAGSPAPLNVYGLDREQL